MSDFLEGLDEVTESDRRALRRATYQDPREALADLSLARVLPTGLRRKIVQGGSASVVIKVPTGQWVQPIVEAIEAFSSNSVVVLGRSEPGTLDDSDVAPHRRLAMGEGVVGVSQDPEHLLPKVLVSVADHRLTIDLPDGRTLARLMRRCLKGPVPKNARLLTLDRVDFDELTSIVASGSPARRAFKRLQARSAHAVSVSNKGGALPCLATACEFGEARRWALDLCQDIHDVRKGKIGWSEVDRGAVFHGAPGCGKTTLARMTAIEAGIPIVVGSLSEMLAESTGHLDGVIKAQRRLFERARSLAPAILFIDEINSLPSAGQLDGSRNGDFWKPVIYDFYQLLDSATSDRDGIVVIGATNRVEDLDPALLRPGRLERAIHIGPPDSNGFENILRHQLAEDLLGADLSLVAIAAAALGGTGADAMDWVRGARRRARRAGRPLALDDLASQVPRFVASPADATRAAVHEAGHAVCGLVLGTDELVQITLESREPGLGGHARFSCSSDEAVMPEAIVNRAVVALAGRAAEAELLGKASLGSGGGEHSDLARATSLLGFLELAHGQGTMLTWRGDIEEVPLAMRLDREFAASVEASMRHAFEVATEVVRGNRDVISALAQELLVRRTLSGDQVIDFLRHWKPPAGKMGQRQGSTAQPGAEAAPTVSNRDRAEAAGAEP